MKSRHLARSCASGGREKQIQNACSTLAASPPRLAKRLAKRGGDAAKVEQAFWICFSRPPDAQERAKCLDFIKQQRLAKREEWTALAAVLLNLDERLTRE